MNTVHVALISYIRDAIDKEIVNPLTKLLSGKTDDQIIRMMFANFRGRAGSARGLRLTNFGVQLMQSYFRAYDISPPPEPHALGSAELLYLDRKAKLPYHVADTGQMIVFDPELGIKLKLADGDVRTLIEMDGDDVGIGLNVRS